MRPPNQYRGLLIGLGVVVGIVFLFFAAVIGLSLLGSTASTKYTQIAMDDDPALYVPDDPSRIDTSETTVVPVAPALVNPASTIVEACPLHDDPSAIDVPAGFEPIAKGGDGSFAQVVRPVYDRRQIIAAVALGSGEIEPSPDAARIGSRSAVVVCVEPADPPSTSVLLCADPNPQMDGSPEYYAEIKANRYRTRVFELASGKMLGEDVIQAEVATCQDGYRKVDVADVAAEAARLRAESRSVWDTNVDVTDEQITSWTVAHLQGGTYH